MKENVIPQINQDIDPKLLVHVLGKNLVWVLFLFVIAITSAFLLIRYTKPIYKSKAVIQLTSEKVENNVLDEKLNPYNSENIAKEIELLKSPVFLSRVTQKIPLGVSYYVKGSILNFENYKATPFVVEYDSISNYNYGKRIDVKFIDAENFKITSTETASPIDGTYKLGEWIDAGDSKFKLVRNWIWNHIQQQKGWLYNSQNLNLCVILVNHSSWMRIIILRLMILKISFRI